MTLETDSYPVQRAVLRTTAAVSGLTAFLAIAGWYFHQPRLVQWSPGVAPMQFNTAVGLLLCSIGLFLVPAAASRTVVWTGGIAALIGLTTLAEYWSGVDLHVDQLLFKSWLALGSASPGRMGANTALCMVLTGLALLLMAVPAKRRRYSLGIALAGSGVSIVSMIAVVGYSMNLESGYRWGARTQMAENTTLAFLMIGVGLITCAVFDAGNGRPLHCRYTPGIAGVASLLFTVLLWQALVVEQNGNLERGSQAATAQVAFEIRAQLANLDGALQRISRRWPAPRVGVPGPALPGTWQFDAGEYITDFTGLEALQWRNESSGVVRVTSDASSPARSRPGFTLTEPHHEIAADSRTTAFVGYESWLGAVLHKEVSTGYSIAVGVDGHDVFRRVDGDAHATLSAVTAGVEVAGEKWTVRVWPGSAVLASSASQLTSLVLLGGLLMSLLLAVTARLVLIAGERADAIEKANRHLQREIVERSDALLTKPIAKATLLKAIAEHLQARPAIRVVAPEGLEELVPGYLKNLHADLRSLSASLEKHDYGAIQVTGHQMKGAGADYGFAAITDIGRGLESAAKAATDAEIQVQIGVLADYLNRVEIVSRDHQAVTIP